MNMKVNVLYLIFVHIQIKMYLTSSVQKIWFMWLNDVVA